MTINDYIKHFNGAKKNFMEKNPPANPKKNPFAYLDNITVDDVVFEPQNARIYKTRYSYNVSASYYCVSGNRESSGNTDNFSSTTKDIYIIKTGGNYEVTDEVKKRYNVSTTYKFYKEFNVWEAIEADAKPKLTQHFINSGAAFCYSSNVRVCVKSEKQACTPETFRDMEWSYIYLKNKKGGKGECIGIACNKEGRLIYWFYRRGNGKTMRDLENKGKNKQTKSQNKKGTGFVDFASHFISAVAVIALIAVVGLIVVTFCAKGWKKFAVAECASGFSINRSSNWSYSIEELGIKQKSNSFYFEDYFVSEELGQEYTVRGAIFPMGTVKLAKKSDHYNPQVYNFNLADYDGKVIEIKSNMNYVRIYSETGSTYKTYISIEKRSMPVDITFENVNITSSPGVPVMCTASICDVNIIARGNNTIKAGKQAFTVEDLKKMVKENIADPLMNWYFRDLKYIYNEVQYWSNGEDKTFAKVYEHYGLQLTNTLLSFTEGAFNFVVGGLTNVIAGRTGDVGGPGADTMMILGGVSVKCEGSLSVIGGAGGDGMNASASLTGSANGGNGGDGGDAICCTSFVTADDYSEETLSIQGGSGGGGGEPSKGGFGLLGSSGNKGRSGKSGVGLSMPED